MAENTNERNEQMNARSDEYYNALARVIKARKSGLTKCVRAYVRMLSTAAAAAVAYMCTSLLARELTLEFY